MLVSRSSSNSFARARPRPSCSPAHRRRRSSKPRARDLEAARPSPHRIGSISHCRNGPQPGRHGARFVVGRVDGRRPATALRHGLVGGIGCRFAHRGARSGSSAPGDLTVARAILAAGTVRDWRRHRGDRRGARLRQPAPPPGALRRRARLRSGRLGGDGAAPPRTPSRAFARRAVVESRTNARLVSS